MHQEFCLDGWLARPELHELVGPDGPVAVEAHSMAVLMVLAETPGEIVTRQELLDRVWDHRYVGEEVLSHAIWDLRRAVGDDSRRPRFIATHRKVGYRLLVEVTRPDPCRSGASDSSGALRRHRDSLLFAGALLFLGAVALHLWRDR